MSCSCRRYRAFCGSEVGTSRGFDGCSENIARAAILYCLSLFTFGAEARRALVFESLLKAETRFLTSDSREDVDLRPRTRLTRRVASQRHVLLAHFHIWEVLVLSDHGRPGTTKTDGDEIKSADTLGRAFSTTNTISSYCTYDNDNGAQLDYARFEQEPSASTE